jgi:glyoxylase-like metal-dependent hydrolase (beta-lactamase superfamily II)
MSDTNASETTVHEIAANIYRINTPVPASVVPGGFEFNQFLIVDDAPLLFHTGMRSLFPAVRQAVARVIDPATLRWVGFSHIEADECGSLNDWLAIAPRAQAIFSQVAAMTSADIADRPPLVMADGQELVLGPNKRLRWLDAPHLPHNWECGYMFEASTRTLLCGDLFTHGGVGLPPLTESEVLSPAEAMRHGMPASVAIDVGARRILNKLAATEPRTLALMHGSSYSGDGGKLLRALGDALGV